MNLLASELESLARKTGFVQRSSECTPQDFISLCVFSAQSVATDSLVHLCNHLDAENKLSLSTEGLNQRFNPAAVAFLKSLFSNLLQDKIGSHSPIFSQVGDNFRRIRILDSTVFQLPDEYVDPYLGYGGSAHTAGMKIQLEYELKSGDFLQVDVGLGKNNDGLYGTKRASTVEPGDLCIRDLGYFCIEDFETMQKQGAFYVSRLKLNVRIYLRKESPSPTISKWKREKGFSLSRSRSRSHYGLSEAWRIHRNIPRVYWEEAEVPDSSCGLQTHTRTDRKAA